MAKGYYIVIEGPEGVGKSTQIRNVAKELTKHGYSVHIFSSDNDNAGAIHGVPVTKLLMPHANAATPAEVLFYNTSRALTSEVIHGQSNRGVVCLVESNYLSALTRYYYGSNSMQDYELLRGVLLYADGDIEPDLTIILDAPVDELATRMVAHNQTENIDTIDLEYLNKVRAGYLLEAKKRGYPVIFANEPSQQVFHYVWEYIAALFNSNNVAKASSTQSLVSPPPVVAGPAAKEPTSIAADSVDYLDKNAEPINITPAGYEKLQSVVTNTEGNIYAFNNKLDQVTVAAAMARLSRRGDDMRVTLLDEFIGKEGKDEGLIHRVVTAYGDDSVQQLVGMHVVIENASNLLTKQIEWGRLAAYLEQSTRYIYYDKKDKNGRYKFYVPKTLTGKVRKQYITVMNELFDNYSKAVHAITEYLYKADKTPDAERDVAWKAAIRAQACDAARAMLPVATKSTVGVFASGQALESLIMRLMADDSVEARECGQALLVEARKVMPAFLERADKPERGGATIAYRSDTRNKVKAIVNDVLNGTYSNAQEAVTLTSFSPKNELDVVPHMVYDHVDMSEQETIAAVSHLPYKDKIAIFSAYIGERLNRRHRPGRALERITYSWDIVCDYGIFRDLQRHRIVSDLAWQLLTPRYGYDIPELIEKAGVAETYLDSFDKSLELNSLLTTNNKIIESQYATLLGHKMRWKVTMNAREAIHFIELRTAPQGHPGYRKLVKQMYDKIAEVHPMVSEAMKFVNKDEDPELTRLAAERYTQYKLQQLDNN